MAEFKKHDVFNLLVSDCGDVIGPSGKTLKLRLSNGGYARVVVYVDGKHKSVLVHPLVAELFLSGPKKEQVNHIDGNKRNNNADMSPRTDPSSFAVTSCTIHSSVSLMPITTLLPCLTFSMAACATFFAFKESNNTLLI